MSKGGPRQIPKALSEFGERQFREVGPDAVDVLRVKASTIRKYWSKLQGIAYLVAVITSDRVRVYFFTSNAIMLVGENIEHDLYLKIRGKSKLIKRYERPKPPTELELRMEATEEVRSTLAKALRRIARFLGEKEPTFPNIYVSKSLDAISNQSFGLQIADDGSYIFLESKTTPSSLEALAIKSAFLCLLDEDRARQEFSQCVSNAITSVLLKDKAREAWIKNWIDSSKDTEYLPIVNHFLNHQESYGPNGLSRILQLLRRAPIEKRTEVWKEALGIIHDHHEVHLGTEAWPIIDGFCKSLEKPRSLTKNRYRLDAIHLSPRVLCNVTPLGIDLGIVTMDNLKGPTDPWLTINYRNGCDSVNLALGPDSDELLRSISYHLRIEDIFPKPGGVTSIGKDILRWALEKFSMKSEDKDRIDVILQMKTASLTEAEMAVLERLSLGDSTILSNTLVGSPQRIDSLLNSGCIAIIPDFGHLGVEPNYLVRGDKNAIQESVVPNVLEASIFEFEYDSFGVVAAPSNWSKQLREALNNSEVDLFIPSHFHSPRNLLRSEVLFPIHPNS